MRRVKNTVSETAKRVALFAVKIAISAGLIFWLFKQNRLEFDSIHNLRLDMYHVVLFLGGAVSVFCGLLLLGLRLWLLLRFKGFSLTYKRVLNLTLMGSFLGSVLPGLVGGDAIKAIYLCSNVPERRMDALASVLVDRVLGIYSLLLLGSLPLCGLWAVDYIQFDPTILLVAPIAIFLSSLGTLLIAWDSFFNVHIIQVLYSRAPKTIQNFINALRGYFKAPKLIILTIILSVFNHTLVLVTFIIAAVLCNDNLSIFFHFIINPLAMVMNAIPLTPGGLGMAESAFSFLFQAAGSPNGAMVGLLGRFIQYTVFISGGSTALLLLKMRSYIPIVDSEKTQCLPERKLILRKVANIET